MRNLNSKLFEKNRVKKDELKKVRGCGVETPCGPAYDGDVEYKDYCTDDGRLFYKKCE